MTEEFCSKCGAEIENKKLKKYKKVCDICEDVFLSKTDYDGVDVCPHCDAKSNDYVDDTE